MSPIPRETTYREVRAHHLMHSSSKAFIKLSACHFVGVLLVTRVPPVLVLGSKDMETPESLHDSDARLLCGSSLQARCFPCALTGVTSHRELSGVGSRSVSERPSVMTMATRLSEVNLRSRLSLVNCRASPV